MPGTHALLSASAASRWLNCPGSARLTENMPDTESPHAAEGTLAHSLAELKVRKKFETMKKSEYDKRFKDIQKDSFYAPEMDGHTDTYLDCILGIAHGYSKVKPYVAIEKQLDYSMYAPCGFGTCDCVMLCKNDLHIFDFKYGKGVPVSAEDNPQLKLYALGAVAEYGFLYDVRNITLHIIQPRLDSMSSFDLTIEELLEWGETIKPIAEAAYTGTGGFKCGDHCRFCKAKANCRARAEDFFSLEESAGLPKELLSNNELGEILERASRLKNWVSDIEEYALSEILSGKSIAGWKAVEGRSNRRITDIDGAFEVLKKEGYDEAMLYEKKPITLTELEKLVTKPRLEELIGGMILKPPGKPTLAPESDKRKPYVPDVKEMFGGE
ncbi:MAG: DUF2800 domain-containing protein [Oscillospiraceae bacterium]|nr:DUF2800 domain-containing protein [Oscillospiraceae bacterium]